MAPEGTLPKRKPKENNYIFDLGVRGRKTGLTVADSGIRDENGLEPLDDHLYSSPEKSVKKKKINGYGKSANATISSEEDMDLGESTIPEPIAVITERTQRGSMRLPPPRSKSPIKTFLQSPARRNPSIGPVSSPSRGPIIESRVTSLSASVRRKLDFSNDSLDTNVMEPSSTDGSPQKRGNSSSKPKAAKFTNGMRLAPQNRPYSPDRDDEDDDTAQTEGNEGLENGEDSFQMVNGGDDEEVDAQSEEPGDTPEPEPEPEPSKKARGKAKATEVEGPEVPVKRGRGRRPKEPNLQAEEDVEEPPAKRTRRSLDGAKPFPQPVQRAKPGRPRKSAIVAKELKSKAAPNKPKLAPIAEAESPQVHRGPPLPRSRGLMITRRETPMDATGFKQTRSGRTSIRPVAFWRGEKAEYSEDEIEDHGRKFMAPRIKGVIRVDEVEEKRKKKSYYRPSKGKKRATVAESDDDEVEPWEEEPGQIVGPIRTWDPEDPTGIQALEDETEIAFSSAAINTRDVPGATFKFAKTLTLPFFGSGMVDLPAGTEKSLKNSRRMQMVFFVFYGKVEVTVNDNRFVIGKGGMWQVPRGNGYSIVNDFDKPARIFFAQGCEFMEEVPDTQ